MISPLDSRQNPADEAVAWLLASKYYPAWDAALREAAPSAPEKQGRALRTARLYLRYRLYELHGSSSLDSFRAALFRLSIQAGSESWDDFAARVLDHFQLDLPEEPELRRFPLAGPASAQKAVSGYKFHLHKRASDFFQLVLYGEQSTGNQNAVYNLFKYGVVRRLEWIRKRRLKDVADGFDLFGIREWAEYMEKHAK